MIKQAVYGVSPLRRLYSTVQRISPAVSYEECLKKSIQNFYGGLEYFEFLALIARLSKNLPHNVAEMNIADVLYYLRQLKKEQKEMQKAIEEAKKGK